MADRHPERDAVAVADAAEARFPKTRRVGFRIDTTALLGRWQTELFGADGGLVDHPK